MKKRYILIKTILLIMLFILPLNATAEEVYDTENLLSGYSEVYGDEIEKGLSFAENIPEFEPSAILDELNSGKFSFDPKEALRYLLKIFLGVIADNAKLLAIVLALSVLCSYLSGLKDGFGSEGISTSAFYACYIIISGICAAAFYDASLQVSQTVSSIAIFMRVIVPIIITALVASGAIVSAASLEPTLLAMVEVAVWLIEILFIPAVMITAALNIVGGMSDKFKTDRMAKLLGSAVRWGLSIVLTVFVSFAGIKSIMSAGVDGLTLKISKFAASNLVPVVGGILAESVETVMNCSVVIKNSVGILGIICIVLIAVYPVVQIAGVLMLFRITAAIAEPITDNKVVLCISRLADSISVLFSMLVTVTVMFVIVLTIMINAGSSAVYLGR